MTRPPVLLLVFLLPALPVLAGIAHHYFPRFQRLVQRLGHSSSALSWKVNHEQVRPFRSPGFLPFPRRRR
ncbi:MAG: hypothetical protein RL260_2807 [Pseudomonadota bacterium]|jgi:hypothetical protein